MAGAIQQVVMNTAAASGAIPIDLKQFKFGVGLLVTLASNTTATYTVQVSGDKHSAPLGTWNSHDVLISKTASANSSLAYPCSMVRLNVTSITSSDSSLPAVTLSVVQAKAL